jgi:hypothetical protein
LIHEIVFLLFSDRELEDLLSEREEGVDVLQERWAVDGGGDCVSEVEVEEAELAAGFPDSVNFGGVVGEEFCEADAEEGGGGDVGWEGWEVGED